MGMYTVVIVLLGMLLGWVARDTWGMWRREVRVIEIEEIKQVVQCRSCNKLRQTIEAAVLDAERRNSPYPLPMVGNGAKRRVHWEMVGVAASVGNPTTTAARASPPPH